MNFYVNRYNKAGESVTVAIRKTQFIADGVRMVLQDAAERSGDFYVYKVEVIHRKGNPMKKAL